MTHHPPVVLCNYNGMFNIYCNPEETDIAPIFIGKSPYEPHVVKYFAPMVKRKRVLDIGSNIGFYTLLALHSGATEAFAVDPNPHNHHLLSLSLASGPFVGIS